MIQPVYRLEVESQTPITLEARCEILSAIRNLFDEIRKWPDTSANISPESDLGPAVFEGDHFRLGMRYDHQEQILRVRYKPKWLSQKVLERCSFFRKELTPQPGFPEELLGRIDTVPMKISDITTSDELLTSSARNRLVRIVKYLQSNPAAYKIKRVGRGLYELLETQHFNILVRVRIKHQNSLMIEDLEFLPNVTATKKTRS